MNSFIHKAKIPFFVFITGACVLIIEIVATRILAPYFGNTIFTVSGVITVVLLALSIGYYVGGKLADKYPSEKIFFGLIAGSGALVLILHVFSLIFLSAFAYHMSLISGPVITSLLFFFFQSLLLGMLSPFAVKLQKVRLESLGVGSASGQIFFWSTLGSIVGSLSSGFFLIPLFGIDKIMLGVGFTLFIVGLFGNLNLRFFPKALVIAILLGVSLYAVDTIGIHAQGFLFYKDSLYQKIIVFDGLYEGKPARFLQQDRNSSSAEFLNSDDLVYEYTKYHVLYQLFQKDISDTLVIGAGAYSVPKDLLKNTKATVDVVEIDPMIYEVGKQFFKVTDDPRLNNFTEDGRRFLHDNEKQYDTIFSDAYASFFSTPEHLTTVEFFKLAKSRLKPNGVFVANVVGSLAQRDDSFALSELRTFKSVFDNSYFFAVKSPNQTTAQNLIFVGYNGEKKITIDGSLAKNYKNPIIQNLPAKQLDLATLNTDSHPLLTDNYAPVDYLISKEFTNLQ